MYSEASPGARPIDLSFDAWMYHAQLGELDEWSARIRELAACPNVYIKLGGLGMRIFGFTLSAGELPPSSEELASPWRPYIDTCIAAFDPERAIFESNFLVDKGSCSYVKLWNAFTRIAVGCSASRRARCLSARRRNSTGSDTNTR
jgi:predicted TIM-barrel fold metal-dependent hydrolase